MNSISYQKNAFASRQLQKISATLCLILLGFMAMAQDVSKSPYFVVKSNMKKVDEMPLKKNEVNVNIAGMIADVVVTQEFENTGSQTLEAIYVFPASTNAAVYGMEMSVGDRKISAKIAEKSKAHETYELAKREGKTASLLEQKRPNVFQMSVGNIKPGDKIKVDLHYTELLIPTNGEYEFVYPIVVGPRYAEEFTSDALYSEAWANNAYLKDGSLSYDYAINTTINAGMPIKKVACNTHKVTVNNSKTKSVIKLNPNEKNSGNKDYIVNYQLAGSEIQSGILLYEEGDENFFLATVQPPKEVDNSKMPPREYVFMLDVSGSMNGFPLETTKVLMNKLLNTLRPEDRFNVMLFESGNSLLSEESVPVTKNNIQAAMNLIDQIKGGGSTNVLNALKQALAFKQTQGFSRSFIVVTDGYITIEQEAFDLIRNNLNNANLFAVGIGSSVNRFLIEGMARAGLGEPLVVTDEKDAIAKAEKFRNYISGPVLTNIKVDYGSFQAYDVEPLSFPDVMAERPVVIFGKYKGKPSGRISLTGLTGNRKKYTQTINVGSIAPIQSNQGIKYLWARNMIKTMGDYQALKVSVKTIQDITNLGLKYNLLTNYTSFIAVDPTKRDGNGDFVTVKQALPMPKGISSSGFGGGNDNGSVSRDVSNMGDKAITPLFGKKHPIFRTKATIMWQGNSKNGLSDKSTYVVTVKDLMQTELAKKEVTGNMLDLDLDETQFQNVMGNALMYQIESKDGKYKSEEMVLAMLNDKEASTLTGEAGTLLLAKTASDKARLAKFYESKGLIANALSVWNEVLEMDSSKTNQTAFSEFMKRNRL
jgi:Ca-activated chloride channel family protein